MNEAVHVRRVKVRLLVPGRGGQHNVGVERGGIHAEIEVHYQVHLSGGRLLVPLHFLHRISRHVFGNSVGVGAEVMFEEVFVSLGAGHQGVAAPDEPDTRPVLERVRVLDGKPELSVPELLHGVRSDFVRRLRARGLGVLHNFQRIAVELRVERQPPAAHRTSLQVHRMPASERALRLPARHGVVVGEILLVAPLVGVNVVPARRVLQSRRRIPIARKGDGRPGLHRRKLFLAHVVSEAAPVHAHAAREHQGVDPGAIHEVVVVPVVHARADDDDALASRQLRRRAPLAREADQNIATDAGVLLGPGRRIGRVLVVVILRIRPREPAPDAVLRHEQIVHSSDGDSLAIDRFKAPHRHAAPDRTPFAEVVQADLLHRIMSAQER